VESLPITAAELHIRADLAFVDAAEQTITMAGLATAPVTGPVTGPVTASAAEQEPAAKPRRAGKRGTICQPHPASSSRAGYLACLR
jgi:hypothetical protein